MKYTRRQILEAINRWENKLAQMNEATNLMMAEFEKTFGSNIVYSDHNFKITTENLSQIFDILNKYIFRSTVVKHPIKIVPLKLLQILFKCQNTIYAVYYRKMKAFIYNDAYHGEVQPGTEAYLISDVNYTFAFIASVLCHEMIHMFVEKTTTILDQIAEAEIRHIQKPNMHSNEFFQKKET